VASGDSARSRRWRPGGLTERASVPTAAARKAFGRICSGHIGRRSFHRRVGPQRAGDCELCESVEVTDACKPTGDRDRDGPVPYAGRAGRQATNRGEEPGAVHRSLRSDWIR
jgi:hypothetical protein